MSKHSSRYSDPKNRKPKAVWESDKVYHKAKLEHHNKVLKDLGLMPQLKIEVDEESK